MLIRTHTVYLSGWWNYFALGLDFLVEEQGTGRVTKIMVHSNIVCSPSLSNPC